MKTSDVFPSQWLAAADVETPTNVTVKGVTVEEIGRDKERKPVIWFNELNKGLICNKTNWTNLAKLCGSDDSDEWSGRAVQLYAAAVQFGGEEVNAVRVRPASTGKLKPAPAAPPATDQQKWGKFYASLSTEQKTSVTGILDGLKPSEYMQQAQCSVDELIEVVKSGLAPAQQDGGDGVF